jgi:predicted GNAT family N-acyltransferase
MIFITLKNPVFEQALWEEVRKIRTEVFVVEQAVDEAEEYDEHESTARHFLAYADGEPAGTARWRQTEKGFKLERFAVLQKFRGKGVGKVLVEAVLSEVIPEAKASGKPIYLHAQVQALPFYAGLGFTPYGELFDEANILHRAMAFTSL